MIGTLENWLKHPVIVGRPSIYSVDRWYDGSILVEKPQCCKEDKVNWINYREDFSNAEFWRVDVLEDGTAITWCEDR